MIQPCIEYKRLLGEYENALSMWAKLKRRDVNAGLTLLEGKYECLLNHLQSCSDCLGRLGYTHPIEADE